MAIAAVRSGRKGSPALTFLRLLLLTAAIVEVDVLRGDFQASRDHSHGGDQLAVLRDHQLLSLALLLWLRSGRNGMLKRCCPETGQIRGYPSPMSSQTPP